MIFFEKKMGTYSRKYSRHSRSSSLFFSSSIGWVIVFGVIALIGYASYEWTYASNLSKTVSEESRPREKFEIEKGTTLSSVLQRLEENNFIVSSWAAKTYLSRNELDTKLVAGTHYISSSMTIPQIMQILTSALQTEKITIPEGLNLEEMDERLANKYGFRKGEFLLCVQKTCDFSKYSFLPENREHLEGYFFPSTYEMMPDEKSAEVLAGKMLDMFQKKMEIIGLRNNKRSLEDLVIMASIIEKESSSHKGDESKMISGILWNRIDQGIPLGADATLRYGLKNPTNALKVSELQSDNPFNTRINKGLPPHAISNPGEHSLLAAAAPARTSYLFYLHDKQKQIYYAITDTQHEANKAKYCGGSCE